MWCYLYIHPGTTQMLRCDSVMLLGCQTQWILNARVHQISTSVRRYHETLGTLLATHVSASTSIRPKNIHVNFFLLLLSWKHYRWWFYNINSRIVIYNCTFLMVSLLIESWHISPIKKYWCRLLNVSPGINWIHHELSSSNDCIWPTSVMSVPFPSSLSMEPWQGYLAGWFGWLVGRNELGVVILRLHDHIHPLVIVTLLLVYPSHSSSHFLYWLMADWLHLFLPRYRISG